MTRQPPQLLITDLDNTLWDWFAAWYESFSALLDGLVALSGVERTVLVDWIDGSKNYRLVIPRCIQIEGVTTALQKGQEARLPLRLAILGGDAVDPFYILTNDPAFDPA